MMQRLCSSFIKYLIYNFFKIIFATKILVRLEDPIFHNGFWLLAGLDRPGAVYSSQLTREVPNETVLSETAPS